MPATTATQAEKFWMGQTIAKLRTERGLSKSEFAKKIGVDPSVVTRIEDGTNYLSFNLGCTIAEYFGMTASELRKKARTHEASNN